MSQNELRDAVAALKAAVALVNELPVLHRSAEVIQDGTLATVATFTNVPSHALNEYETAQAFIAAVCWVQDHGKSIARRLAGEGFVLVSRDLIDRFPEINPANYDRSDVEELNAWGVEIVLAATPPATTENGK